MSDLISFEICDAPTIVQTKHSKYAGIVKAIKSLPKGKALKFDAGMWTGRSSHIGEPIRTACSAAGIKVSIRHDKPNNVLYVTRI